MLDAIITGAVAIIVCLLNNIFQMKKIQKISKQAAEAEAKATKLGIQALLRDRLYWTYNHYNSKGYAPIYARENFTNMYNQYHSLGANGVMDDIKEKFESLPTEAAERNYDGSIIELCKTGTGNFSGSAVSDRSVAEKDGADQG